MSTIKKNPIRRYKDRHELTYTDLAATLDISEDYARKIGADLVKSVSRRTALKFEERTGGEIQYADVMRWIDENVGGSA